MTATPRTFAIGDIHGEPAALERLLGKLPALGSSDTLVFIGDYVDRGPDSRGVVQRVRALQRQLTAKVVCLRGNHEDKWMQCYEKADPAFMLPAPNGCAQTFRSFTGGKPLVEEESLDQAEYLRFFNVQTWMPPDVIDWMKSLPLWYEDEHAIYVHAGLDGDDDKWVHPREGREKSLLWGREPEFFTRYKGKRVVFGHTLTSELPTDHLGKVARWLDDPGDVWVRNDLIGLDTGCGKGGYLSAVELPRGKVYESK